MALEGDEIGKSRKDHVLGQDLYGLSLDELRSRIAALLAEVTRIEREIESKSAHRDAAAAMFRR